jgi:hypothetical protein
MRLVGDSPVAALRICAFLSLFLPVTVFLLLQRLGCRCWVAAFGAALVCLQPKLFPIMTTPDVTLSYDLITTVGFILLLGVLRDRPSLIGLLPSAFVLALPIWLRGEGFVPILAACVGILAAPWPWKQRLISVAGFAALVGICLFPYVFYNLHFFGRITPEPRSLTPLMTDYKQFYELESHPSLAEYCKTGFSGIVGLHVEALSYFSEFLWQNIPYLLLLTGILGPLLRLVAGRRAAEGGATRVGQTSNSGISGEPSRGQAPSGSPKDWRAAGIATLWTFVVLSGAVPLLIAPIVSNYDRFLLNTMPVLCVLAVWTIDPMLRYRCCANAGILLAAAVLLAYVQWPFYVRKPWTTAWKDRFLSIPTCFLPGNHPALNADDVVLSEIPCRLSAQLNVGSIIAPWDDTVIDATGRAAEYQRLLPIVGYKRTVLSAEACRQAIDYYHPRFIFAEDGSILARFVDRLKDLPLRAIYRGQNQNGRGYTWFAVGAGAESKSE